MKQEEILVKIRSLISENKSEEALPLLEGITKDAKLKDELILLKSRMNSVEELERLGIEEYGTINIEKNKITKSLVEITRKVDTQSSPVNVKDEITLLEELLNHLDVTSNIFKVQRRLRKKLYEGLTVRITDLTFDNKYHMMSKYYPQLTTEELRTHKTIRGFTERIVKEQNYKVLDLLQKNPTLEKKITGLGKLELHLTIWKNKFESTFYDDESVCWIYAGIDEGVGFPDGIEEEIKRYLNE